MLTLAPARKPRTAVHHGLSLPVYSDPILSEEMEALAREIAGEGASHEIVKLAHRVSEAQIDIVHIRLARHDFLSRYLNDPRQMWCNMLIIFFIGSHKVRKNLHTSCLISPRSSLRLTAMNGARSRDANLPLETSMQRAVRRSHEELRCIAAIGTRAFDVWLLRIYSDNPTLINFAERSQITNVSKG